MEKGTASLIFDKNFYLGHRLLRNNDVFYSLGMEYFNLGAPSACVYLSAYPSVCDSAIQWLS